MDGELKAILVSMAVISVVALFVFVCAPALGIHIPVPQMK